MARAGGKRSVEPSGNASSAATRAALVAAAADALREVGFAGASAREIARRADCQQSLVFYHFGSVAKLHLAALDQVSGGGGPRARPRPPGGTPGPTPPPPTPPHRKHP
ncbi:TetR/AcrR family transcriptional regulator, partial [Streptomyces sp. NPDC059627]